MTSRVVRVGGLVAMVGGVLWMAGIVLYALGPSGPGTSPPYREFDFAGVLLLVAMPLLLAGVLGLRASYGDRSGGMGTGTAVLTIAGTALFVVSAFAGLPWTLVMLGFYGACLGAVLMGAVAIQTGAVPNLVAAALIVGSAALFFFNTETAAAWLALPFGAAWAAVGYALLRREEGPTAGRPARGG